ncbi:MAG: DUF2024 family protein [Bacteroidota bacterium]
MKVAVWVTYVTRKSNRLMHFDIIVPESTDEERVLAFGRGYFHVGGNGKWHRYHRATDENLMTFRTSKQTF